MTTYNLNFQGYWLEGKVRTLPQGSGIYFVYKCIYDVVKDSVKLLDLLYISKADNIYQQLVDFDKTSISASDDTLCFSCALVDKDNLNIVEDALILVQKPAGNQIIKESFDYSDLEFHLTGRCNLFKCCDFRITKD